MKKQILPKSHTIFHCLDEAYEESTPSKYVDSYFPYWPPYLLLFHPYLPILVLTLRPPPSPLSPRTLSPRQTLKDLIPPTDQWPTPPLLSTALYPAYLGSRHFFHSFTLPPSTPVSMTASHN